ncbi:Calcium homeostasis endoplasmic reticulum protein [Aphelenchoides bicaudatus]|nr:Calcium homeostasis endoplasmic reticulum protein [Aphelenchoides bicaudatus]
MYKQQQGPPPPHDPQLCDEINRFAAYIAANGPQAEEIARRDNYGNPRFCFLFNGMGASYYQYRLATEINNLKQMAQNPPPVSLMDIKIPPPKSEPSTMERNSDPEIDPLEVQIQTLKRQTSESETNLKAHHDTMLEIKNGQVEKIYEKSENDRIFQLLDRVGVNYEPFVHLIDHLAVSASKETISNAKHWIFSNCDTDQKREICLTYLLHRCRTDNSSNGNLCLHILYLLNDWAYYCQRQRLDNIRQMLSRYVPKMFAHATLMPNISNKLEKLQSAFESSKFFDDNCYKQLNNPNLVLASENTMSVAEKSKIGDEVERELRQTYANYQKQHMDYERHNLNQIASLQSQIAKIKEMRTERTRLKAVQRP